MTLYQIFIFFDTAIYSLVAFSVKLIMLIANYDFFGSDVINDVYNKIYIILGIVMLFKIVISAVQYLINPDTFDDKDKGMAGLLKKATICMVLLVVVRPMFDFAKYMQTSIVSTIPGIVMGSDQSNYNIANDQGVMNSNAVSVLEGIGDKVAGTSLRAFITKKTDTNNGHNQKADVIGDKFSKIDGNNGKDPDNPSYANPRIQAIADNITAECQTPWHGLSLDPSTCLYNYQVGISTIAGIFLLYVMVSMMLDVAIRAIKFGIIELLAPIPISSYMVSKDKLSKFFKLAGKVYADLFVRLGVIYFIVFFVEKVISGTLGSGVEVLGSKVDDVSAAFIKIAIIIGLFMFAKNAPKFICDVLGIDSGGVGDMKDMFKPQRLGSLVRSAYNPFGTAVSNYRKAMANNTDMAGPNGEKGRRRINALRRAAAGAGRGTFDAAAALVAGDDWSKIRQRQEKAVAKSNRRGAQNYMKRTSKLDASKRTDEIEQKRKELEQFLNYGKGRDVADMLDENGKPAKDARANYAHHMSDLKRNMNNLSKELYTGKDASGRTLTAAEIAAKRTQLANATAEYNRLNTTTGKNDWIQSETKKLAAQQMASNKVQDLQAQYQQTAAQISGIRNEITTGRDAAGNVLTAAQINERRSQVIALEQQNAELKASYDSPEARAAILEAAQADIAEYDSKTAEYAKLKNESYILDDNGDILTVKKVEPEISTKSIIAGKLDKAFGGEGFTGQGYIDTADLLKTNRSNLYTGEAMTKMRQNADVLVDSSGKPVEFTAKFTMPGVTTKLTYADMADLKKKVDNGTITTAELQAKGFANGAMVQSAFEDIEKQAAEAYVTANMAAVDPSIKTDIVLKPGVAANSTIVQGINRMIASLSVANISPEEREKYVNKLKENPGKFFKEASDEQERIRTKGSNINAFNSGKKNDS